VVGLMAGEWEFHAFLFYEGNFKTFMGNDNINIKEIFKNGFEWEDIENLFLLCNSNDEVQNIYEAFKDDKEYEELPADKKVLLCYFVYEVVPKIKKFE
jgi:hypothetical protein